LAAPSQSQIAFRRAAPWTWTAEARHRMLLRIAIAVAVVFLCGMVIHGFPYYRLDLPQRPHSPLDSALRPGGFIGIRLGMLGLGMFFLLFLYPIRKRWTWLSRIGKTRHWLDFHVLLGITAPIVITLHSSFKLNGLAGAAYWIMMAVSLSGFVGRYLYAQIPRSLNTAELSLREMEEECARMAEQLKTQALLTAAELEPLMRLPSRETIASIPVILALAKSVYLDVTRPVLVSGLRRRFLTPGRIIFTLGGLLPSDARLENVIGTVRAHSWMSTKILFLARVRALFHLWHVVHRPFSYGFVVLVAVHVTVALLFGYFR
jgi:hypothetical protein